MACRWVAVGAERVPRLPPAKARERMLLEEENVRAFEELLRAALSTSFAKAVSTLLEELGC